MSATVIDLRPGLLPELERIRADLADIGIDITVTGRDLCYSNRRATLAILRANHEALGQAIEQLDARGGR
jgi:hypothetical protein